MFCLGFSFFVGASPLHPRIRLRRRGAEQLLQPKGAPIALFGKQQVVLEEEQCADLVQPEFSTN